MAAPDSTTAPVLPVRRYSGKNKRAVRLDGPVAYVPLTRGLEAIIDAADADHVARKSWYAKKSSTKTYATTTVLIDGKGKMLKLHHLLLPRTAGKVVDHINGNTLDNRRSNLRLATHKENMRNSARARNGHINNVRFHKRKGKFEAFVYLGTFERQEDAALAVAEAEGALNVAMKNRPRPKAEGVS